MKVDTDGTGRSASNPLTPAEEEDFRRLAASPNIYDVLAKSIAPSIYGSIDMKKAIACLLFGGSRKRLVLLQIFVLLQYKDFQLLLYNGL